MTSRKALGDLRFYVSMSQDIDYKEANKKCDIIEKDLEVLEALKENYSGAIKRENHLMINDMDLVDARDVKVKEWLTND